LGRMNTGRGTYHEHDVEKRNKKKKVKRPKPQMGKMRHRRDNITEIQNKKKRYGRLLT